MAQTNRQTRKWAAQQTTDLVGAHTWIKVTGEVQTFVQGEEAFMGESIKTAPAPGILMLDVAIDNGDPDEQHDDWAPAFFSKESGPASSGRC